MNESAFVPYSESDYKKLTRLGNGDFGVVWKIQLQASGEYCAIEYISERNREKALHDLKAKAHILHLVSSPYIIRMIGFQFQEPYALLTEYCPGGTLRNFLTNHKTLPLNITNRLATEIIEALKPMHTNGIIHCNLKPSKILLTKDLHIKLADPGISMATKKSHRIKKYLHHEIQVENVTWEYTAPELLRRVLKKTLESITPAVDIYSFGVVMWQLFTSEQPYAAELQSVSKQDLQRKICENICILDSKHPQIPRKWQEIISKCWNPIGDNRPSCDVIANVAVEFVEASGLFNFAMDWLRRDDTKAAKYLRMAADKEYPPALWYMALYSGNAKVDFKRLNSDVFSGDVLNTTETYLLHLKPDDNIPCYEWLRRGSEHGHASAQALLGWRYLYDDNYKEAVKWSRLSSKQRHPIGQCYLGVCYNNGWGVAQDHKEAVKCFRLSAAQNYARGQCNLGVCYDKGEGIAQDHKEAVKLYRLSANQGCASAQTNLGVCFEHGRGVVQDHTKAATWYRLSAEQGNAGGQYNLGICYEYGRGVDRDYKEAIKWYRHSANQGYAYGECNLGVCYEHGWGVVQDYKEAVKWYRLSADKGNVSGQCNLGLCYEYGRGVEGDYDEAVKWYRLSAGRGDARGQFNVGYCYAHGRGVAQDDKEAVKWYRLSAGQGYAHGEYNLGECYEYGCGVAQDYKEAVKWYRLSAKQGFARGQFNLGECYEYGNGVKGDFKEAVKWYRLAAEQGLETALKKLG